MELVRYVHLNPLRAKVVADLRMLDRYPWIGHSALLGTVPRLWQDTATILAQFAPTRRRAVAAHRAFVAAGLPAGRRSALARARAGIAYLWVDMLGHPGRPLAPRLGVSPQAVYQAVARGRETRGEWERLLRR